MSKRKKPKIYLTHELKDYYRDQMRHWTALLQRMAASDPGTAQEQLIPFIERINALECMHVIWHRGACLTGDNEASTHGATMSIAVAKGLEAYLTDTLPVACRSLSDDNMDVISGITDSQQSARYSIPGVPVGALSRLADSYPELGGMDLIGNREKYFAVEHVLFDIRMNPAFEGDMFLRLQRFAAAWERITQTLEFAGESWALDRQ